PNALGSISDGTTVISGASLVLCRTNTFATEQLSINGTGASFAGALRTSSDEINDTVTWQGNVTLQSNCSVGSHAPYDILNITGIIEGIYQLTTDGLGIISMSGINTFSGGLIVNDGITIAKNNQALGDFSSTVTVNNGASLDIYGQNLQGYTQNITINGQTDASTGALINTGADQQNAIRQIALGSDASIGNNGNRFDIGRNYAGATCITGNNHTLTKVGSNYVALVGDATGLSGVNVNGGTLCLEADNAVGTSITVNSGAVLTCYGARFLSNSITMNSGGTISSSGNSPVIFTGTLSVSGSTTLNNSTTGTVIFNNVISGTGSIKKTGSGIITLNGTNTYTGTTTVSAGTLNLYGSTASGSAVSVASGATLGGRGTANGSVTVNNGGILSPGYNSANKFTTGVLALDNTSVLNFDLGKVSDTIAVNGNLLLDGRLNITAASGFSVGSYTLITFTGNCLNDTLVTGTVPDGFLYSITVAANKVVLNVTAPGGMYPITVKNNIGTGISDTCLIYTDYWSLIFDEDDGGQIKFLSGQADGAGTNQVWNIDRCNLFSVQFNQGSYNVSGQLDLVKTASFFAVLTNTYTLNSIKFIEEYTIYGSGVVYVKVTAVNLSGSSQTQPLRFITVRKNDGGSVRKTITSTASNCPYMLNAETTTGQFDILLAIKNQWSSATGFVNTADNNSYLGYECSSYSFTDKMRRSWEFMLDFSKHIMSDTSALTNTICG
ncbi:MAG TPA: autotransporter-associated beta strand repeat-containing protein, partial [Chitinispirillaceae bacterium]|nr:autotransporter-associated beta strand repeat-containing protein [Chitinispirillaceae bacterium]